MTKPVTNAEMLRSLLKAVNGHRSPKPTVTLKTNAKGHTQIEVTAYGRTADEAGTSAQAVYDRIRDRYRLEELIDHQAFDAAVAEGTPFD